MLDNAAVLIVFCATLFVYVHVFYHLKVCDDLEVYRISASSKEKLETACQLRQPVLFHYDPPWLDAGFDVDQLHTVHSSGDLQIRNTEHMRSASEFAIPLSLGATSQLLATDRESRFFTEHNWDLVEETGLAARIRSHESFLKPPTTVSCEYDILSGSAGAYTPFRYHVNFRQFLAVSCGTVQVRISSPKAADVLSTINDYDTMESRTGLNPWAPQGTPMASVPFADVTLRKGDVMFIPAYWWHSIKFGTGSSVVSLSYRTFMSTASIAHRFVLKFLQQQNTRDRTELDVATEPCVIAPGTSRPTTTAIVCTSIDKKKRRRKATRSEGNADDSDIKT